MDKQFKDYGTKVVYRPIEAAIRWSGLLRQEGQILKTLPDLTHRSRSISTAQWPQLAFNIARLFDGLLNKELPYGENGVTRNDPALLDSPHLTVRHVDVKRWMIQYYPEEKPSFLFYESEHPPLPLVDIETMRILLVERDGLKAQLQIHTDALNHLRIEHKTLRDKLAASENNVEHPRTETTHLHIIGALLSVMLGDSPGGKPYSAFKSQEAIIDALIAHHASIAGITQRTLQTKFAEANRRLANAKNAAPQLRSP